MISNELSTCEGSSFIHPPEPGPLDDVDNTDRLFLTGVAGSGKTYTLKQKMADDRGWGLMCATTGIAAVNLDTVTLNSVLGYFDTASLADKYLKGKLTAKLSKLSKNYEWLWVDETSMMDKEQLDLIEKAVYDLNDYETVKRPIKLGLTGDFCQLPPVKADWAFRASCWHKFQSNTKRLTKIYRQSDPKFLEALNLLRSGEGGPASEVLRTIPEIQWSYTITRGVDDLTTIVGTNDEVNRMNWMALNSLPGPMINVPSYRWGKQRGEWKNIPEILQVKENALVMILANAGSYGDAGMVLDYANGDCGHIRSYYSAGQCFGTELNRNGDIANIEYIVRRNTSQEPDPNVDYDMDPFGHGWGKPYYDEEDEVFVNGAIRYIPLRPAFATTVHKSQGLSLDTVQIDMRHHFMGEKNMVYVAMSRAKSPMGLRIVGGPELVASRCQIAEEVRPWL